MHWPLQRLIPILRRQILQGNPGGIDLVQQANSWGNQCGDTCNGATQMCKGSITMSCSSVTALTSMHTAWARRVRGEVMQCGQQIIYGWTSACAPRKS